MIDAASAELAELETQLACKLPIYTANTDEQKKNMKEIGKNHKW